MSEDISILTSYNHTSIVKTFSGIDLTEQAFATGREFNVTEEPVSNRMTEQSNLAPFSYFGIPLSFILGWLFFDESPWSTLFPGGILIAAGGLLIVWRERSQDKSKSS